MPAVTFLQNRKNHVQILLAPLGHELRHARPIRLVRDTDILERVGDPRSLVFVSAIPGERCLYSVLDFVLMRFQIVERTLVLLDAALSKVEIDPCSFSVYNTADAEPSDPEIAIHRV